MIPRSVSWQSRGQKIGFHYIEQANGFEGDSRAVSFVRLILYSNCKKKKKIYLSLRLTESSNLPPSEEAQFPPLSEPRRPIATGTPNPFLTLQKHSVPWWMEKNRFLYRYCTAGRAGSLFIFHPKNLSLFIHTRQRYCEESKKPSLCGIEIGEKIAGFPR